MRCLALAHLAAVAPQRHVCAKLGAVLLRMGKGVHRLGLEELVRFTAFKGGQNTCADFRLLRTS